MIDKITNYIIDNKYDAPNITISYISFFEETAENIKLQNIMENRSISVDVLLDERPASDLSLRYDSDDVIATITPKLFSLDVSGLYYKDYSDIEASVFNKLNVLTNGSSSLDINTSNLIYPDIKRKIETALVRSISNINRDSRKSGNCIILMGYDMIDYGIKNIHHVDVVITDRIPKDKIIVISSENNCSVGINLVINEKNSMFYLRETQDYEKVIKYFTVK